jgi:uncharacterized LabA/DUF88 family protein
VSKNVAVFVDVANIFYAAKAGGVDIDYVTLLKSATAGRDFVRAYAYTGLDPENENQRQFHAFLARSGYKVVSKDIRKYGDGRIKANLDIELVVDMMRLARNLDIAVVVSGDGDFAPAIRAVQEMGVRVEVISFRGNTSADLIEAADQFTDIAQIARVDKTSARSGRRVAAEGDLSMTAVPEKETEGAPRRRRGRAAAERTTAAERSAEREVAAAGLPGNLIVLPGERLSRGASEALDGEEPEAASGGDTLLEEGEAGDRRRRRRRGGRGRGRGRRGEGLPSDALERTAVGGEEDEEDFAEEPPAALPQHSFGSVWDTQIGLPSAPLASGATAYRAEPGDEDEDLDEPEVPEYLLAERRQRQRGAGSSGRRMGRGGGRQGAYQAAVERERYGRGGGGGGGGSGGGFGGSRLPERPRHDRPDRGRGRGGPMRSGRPDRAPEPRPAPAFSGPPSGDPWSEVPAELEELLRAEVARKIDRQPSQPAVAVEPAPLTPALEATPEDARPSSRRRAARTTTTAPKAAARRTTAKVAAGATTEKPKRATRSRTAKAASPVDETAATTGDASADVAVESAPPAKKPARTRRKKANGDPDAAGQPAPSDEAPTGG